MTAALVGAYSTLACTSFISGEALASGSVTVADTLVRALHVCVRFLSSNARVHLPGVFLVPLNIGSRIGYITIVVQVTLRGIDKSKTELASTLATVSTLPVTVASAVIFGATVAMAGASIGALGAGISQNGGDNNPLHFLI
jgi:hypothetical protein